MKKKIIFIFIFLNCTISLIYFIFKKINKDIIYRKATYFVSEILLPSDSLTTAEHSISNFIFQGLFRINGNLGIEPDLIETWHFDELKMTYYFRLKQNVHFSNGKDVTSEIVKESLDYLVKLSKNSSLFSNIESIAVKDRLNFSIKVKNLFPSLIVLLSSPQAKIWTKQGIYYLGSGQFKIKNISKLKYKTLYLIKNQFYNGKYKIPFKEVEFIQMNSDQVKDALDNKVVDDTLDMPLVENKYTNDKYSTKEAYAAITWLLAVNSKKINKHERICLRTAFDSISFINEFLPTHIVNNGYLPSQLPGSKITTQNDINDKNCKNKKIITLDIPEEIENTIKMCNRITEYWNKIGFYTNCNIIPFDSLLNRISDQSYNVSLLAMSMDIPSVDYFFSFFTNQSKLNLGNIHSSFFLKLIEKLNHVKNRTEQVSVYSDLNQFMYDEVVTINISNPKQIYYYNNCISGLDLNIAGSAYTDYSSLKWSLFCH